MQLLEEEASEAALAETMLEGLGGALGMPSSEGRGRNGASLQVSVNSCHASFCLITELAYTVYAFPARSVLQDVCCRAFQKLCPVRIVICLLQMLLGYIMEVNGTH